MNAESKFRLGVGEAWDIVCAKFVKSDCLCGIFIAGRGREHSRRGVHPFLPLIDSGGTTDAPQTRPRRLTYPSAVDPHLSSWGSPQLHCSLLMKLFLLQNRVNWEDRGAKRSISHPVIRRAAYFTACLRTSRSPAAKNRFDRVLLVFSLAQGWLFNNVNAARNVL